LFVSCFAELVTPILTVLPVSQWLMSFDVAFIIVLFFVYLAFLAGEHTYFAEVWLQLIICEYTTTVSFALLVSLKCYYKVVTYAPGSK
jgi:hypothetical protein